MKSLLSVFLSIHLVLKILKMFFFYPDCYIFVFILCTCIVLNGFFSSKIRFLNSVKLFLHYFLISSTLFSLFFLYRTLFIYLMELPDWCTIFHQFSDLFFPFFPMYLYFVCLSGDQEISSPFFFFFFKSWSLNFLQSFSLLLPCLCSLAILF